MNAGKNSVPGRRSSGSRAARRSHRPCPYGRNPAEEASGDRRTGLFAKRPASSSTGGPALFLPLVLFFLIFCLQPEPCLADAELAEALAGCLPAPEEGWIAEPVVVEDEKTDLGAGKIWASRQYRQTDGRGEVDIKVHKSRWCCWLISFSGDIRKITVKGRKAGLDEERDESTVHVRLRKQIVVSVQAENLPASAEAARKFASAIDYDKLEALILK